MWPFGGLTLVTFGLAPSALHWLTHGPETVWHAAACYALVDAAFVLGAFLFLYIGVKYGDSRSQARPAPYPGAWVEHDGHQQTPRGFAPGYLSFALVVSLVLPALVLLASSGPARPFVFATLGPYLLVFLPQITLETKYLSRSFMTPVLPVLFMYYRLWQFMRSLQLVAGTTPLQDGGPTWLRWYLLSLLAFWVFDTGCTMIWLPWMYDWQLQDAALLRQLAEHRQQQHPEHNILLQQAKAALSKKSGGVAAMPESRRQDAATPAHGVTTRSRARTPGAAAAAAAAGGAAAATASSAGSRRKRAAAAYPEGTDNIDSFGFGA